MKKTVIRYTVLSAVCLIIAAIVIAAGFAMSPPLARAEYKELGRADGVEHIFTHELVFDTAKAYAPGNKLRACFDKDHLTSREFSALLSALYDRGYALITLDDAISGNISVPSGKRPLVMSFDDMTYDTINRGCIDKIVLRDGELYDFTRHAEPNLTQERENITILEKFIEAHPDFSVRSGRATICVNGYNGILGYRITPDSRVSERVMREETEKCRAVVAELKRRGYTFASHSYYHTYFTQASVTRIEEDCAKWKKYIEPVVGKTRVFCFPAGQHSAKSDKITVLKRYGFDTFLCVGIGATEYERGTEFGTYFYRKPFDGTALRLYKKQYAYLVDTEAIYDKTRYRPFSFRGNYR